MVDETTWNGIVDPTTKLHTVRSHRKPPSNVGSFISLVIIGCVSAVIATSAIPLERPPVRQPQAPVTVAPLALPIPEPVRAPVTVTEPSTMPSVQSRNENNRAQRAQRPEPVDTTATVSTDKIERVIAFALAQQGDRYVFGAAGPSTYDCSGLVVAAFKTVGMNLYHYTGRQMTYGTRVGSKSQLKRGDIVFPTGSHVGIYLGNGKMVHASSSRGRVVIGDVYSYYAGRRLL
jgi:cell wall-associated NlpC family hydrolase